MLNKTHLQVWQYGELESNFYIGNVGDVYGINYIDNYITDSGNYINKRNFRVDRNNNVSFLLRAQGSIRSSYTFRYSNMTWFLDVDGRITEITGRKVMSNCNSMEALYLPNVKTLGYDSNTYSFSRFPKLRYGIFNNVGSGDSVPIGQESLSYSSEMRMLSLDGLQRIGIKSYEERMKNLISLRRLYIPNLTKDNPEFLASVIRNIIWAGLNPQCKVYLHPSYNTPQSYSYDVFVSSTPYPGDTFVCNGLTYTGTDGINNDYTGEYHCANMASYNAIISLVRAISDDKRSGTVGKVTATNMSHFSSTIILASNQVGSLGNTVTYQKLNSTVEFNLKHGNVVHPLLTQFNNNGNQVIFKDDYTTVVNTPTNLSFSNLTVDSIDLNFSHADNVNGTHGFEVWINDRKTPWHTLVPYDEIELSGDTLDLTDRNMIGLLIKIRAFDGQMNYSEFTEEIRLP